MDSQRILDDLPMRPLQVVAVVLCIALNALDGFDVLAISFSVLRGFGFHKQMEPLLRDEVPTVVVAETAK